MYAFLLTEAWGCRDFVLSTRIEQAFDATKDGRKQIHRLIGQNSMTLWSSGRWQGMHHWLSTLAQCVLFTGGVAAGVGTS